ncbi:MAG: hypothetical protein ACO1OB_09095 [Archangium sp.]
MELGVYVIGFVVVAVIVVVLVLRSRREDDSRAAVMKRWGRSHGFTFEANDTALAGSLKGFRLMANGGAVSNVLRAEKVEFFDFEYTTAGIGNDPGRTHLRTVVAMHGDGRAPHFFLRRQHAVLDALGTQLGGQDVNFEDDPAFSEKFVLQTRSDVAALRAFFTPEVRAAFTSLKNRDLVIEGRDGVLLVHQGKRLEKPNELDALFEDATSLRTSWS